MVTLGSASASLFGASTTSLLGAISRELFREMKWLPVAVYCLNVLAETLGMLIVATAVYSRFFLSGSCPTLLSKLLFLLESNVLGFLKAGPGRHLTVMHAARAQPARSPHAARAQPAT